VLNILKGAKVKIMSLGGGEISASFGGEGGKCLLPLPEFFPLSTIYTAQSLANWFQLDGY
jgi:hypothetical protein